MNRKQRLELKLNKHLTPIFIEVIDESHRHHVPDNAETHFKVIAVSNIFEGMALIKRHRLVNEIVADERDKGMHALSLYLKTPKEWKTESTTPDSPACRDGYKHG